MLMSRSSPMVITLVTLLLVTGLTPLCAAQQPSSPVPMHVTRGPQNVTELARFLNTTMAEQLENYGIAGATVAVVKDGKLFYAHGYGYADVEHKTPVNANVSVFQIGSITKLFTWTAVMQLVQKRKIDLHADVNTYLEGFQLPSTYPQPITMQDLMTHTAGFEEVHAGQGVSSPADIKPLGTVLAQTIPERMWPPGHVWSYSNWGTDLAGYIVQEVSGEPFDQYLQHHIFTPLGMHHTTIEQPVPAPLAANVSKTYAPGDDTFEQTAEGLVPLAPDGAIHSTASDMAKFMSAHLNNGTYNNTRILSASATREMRRAHFAPDPYTKFGLGFFMADQSNESNINHAGDVDPSSHALCMLWPARNVGLFVAYNSPGGTLARWDLIAKFLDHYYPYTPVPPQTHNANDAPSLSGTYQNTQSAYTTVFKYFDPPKTVDISGYSNGTFSSPSLPFLPVEIAPLTFATPDGDTLPTGESHFIFATDSNGTYFHTDANPQYWERLAWDAIPANVNNLGYVCLAVFLSVALWPLSTLHGRWRHRRHGGQSSDESRTRLPPLAHWVMGITAILYWLTFLFYPYLVSLILGPAGTEALLSSLTIPPPIVAWLTLPLIAISLTVVGVILTVLAWQRRYWTTFGRIHYTVVVGAALAFIIWLSYWNLIGFRW